MLDSQGWTVRWDLPLPAVAAATDNPKRALSPMIPVTRAINDNDGVKHGMHGVFEQVGTMRTSRGRSISPMVARKCGPLRRSTGDLPLPEPSLRVRLAQAPPFDTPLPRAQIALI